MIYAHKVRREREAVFGAFDCPDAGQSTARRRESTTPIQALNLFNSRFTLDASGGLRRPREERKPATTSRSQIRRAYQLALSRDPPPTNSATPRPSSASTASRRSAARSSTATNSSSCHEPRRRTSLPRRPRPARPPRLPGQHRHRARFHRADEPARARRPARRAGARRSIPRGRMRRGGRTFPRRRRMSSSSSARAR